MNESDDYLWDRSGPPDPEVQRLEDLLAPLAHQAPLRRRSKRPIILAGAVALAASIALVAWWRWPGEPAVVACAAATSGFTFTAKTGTVACEGASLTAGRLPVGGTLDTGSHRAELAIASIGTAELGQGTRVRLDRTGVDGHQLHLERGHMHARVLAPPRIFAVTTPSVDVTDLGCEYAIDIAATGAGEIRVITGMVELETGTGAVVVAPAGTHARLLPGRRASLPLEDKAGPALVAAVAGHERGDPDGVERVLTAATSTDGITVANLYALVRTRRVLERLAELSPPIDEGVTIDAAQADPKIFARWLDEIIEVRLGAAALPF